MKKIVMLITLISLLMLTACGEKKEVSGDEREKETVVGFIYVGPVGDGGWSYQQDQGRIYLEKELGVKTLYKESVPEGPEVKDIARQMIDQGANLIVAGSFGYMDYIEELSNEYKDVTFLHCSGYKTTENMANFFGRMYEARFLSGLAAGLKTESNKIGYVAAFPIPEVIRGINAFTLGVKTVNPEASVEVVWTNTWYDPAKEKDAAISLLDKNIDVIAQHQDTAGPQQAAEERGVFSIGYNSDMTRLAPNAHIIAPVWNWGPYFVEQVKALQAGNWNTGAYWGGLDTGTVTLSPLTENAAPKTAELIEEYKQKIINGEFHVFSGPLKNQSGEVVVGSEETISDADMLSMSWFVDGVIGKIK